jgi:hypothetical protein
VTVPLVEMVSVTGQVVTVSYVTTVVVKSSGAGPVVTGATDEGAGVVLASQAVQMVEVEVRVTVETVL